ncbi:MAG: ImmA/IrrE family metallo-endopeptidase [Acidimicrobiia bacterium]|nr:ImmA/IrrE family metallo-endopeptidase [Acidimicrobiia bacterium]
MTLGIVTQLRDFVPLRPLTRAEAYRIAELQAIRFLKLTGASEPPLGEATITQLPRMQVQRFSPLPVSGATEWSHGRWLVLLNGAEPIVRQRFSLAHEFKHIVDHRFHNLLYRRIPKAERHQFVESLCDYFAGCLLVPKVWLRRAWTTGVQRPDELARLFGVSQMAIQVRLAQTGLAEPAARCSRSDPRWTLPELKRRGTREGYLRRAPLPT